MYTNTALLKYGVCACVWNLHLSFAALISLLFNLVYAVYACSYTQTEVANRDSSIRQLQERCDLLDAIVSLLPSHAVLNEPLTHCIYRASECGSEGTNMSSTYYVCYAIDVERSILLYCNGQAMPARLEDTIMVNPWILRQPVCCTSYIGYCHSERDCMGGLSTI